MGSSIGYVGTEPVVSSSQRLRGFLTGVYGRDELDAFGSRFDGYRAHVLVPGSPETRLSLRLVAEDDVVGELPDREATIALDGGRSLVYLGVNAPSRELSSAAGAALDDQRRSAAAHFAPGGGADIDKLVRRFAQAAAKGYSVQVTDRLDARAALAASDLPAIASLLMAFGYEKDEAAAIVDDPANLIGVVRYGPDVVGFGISETVEVPLAASGPFPTLRLAELTDSIVDDHHTGNGLQSLIHVRLMDALLQRSAPPDLIFSESTYGGSLHNAATLGRAFAGRLPNHAIIETGPAADASSPPRYQSLEVTSTTATEAARLLGQLRDLLDEMPTN